MLTGMGMPARISVDLFKNAQIPEIEPADDGAFGFKRDAAMLVTGPDAALKNGIVLRFSGAHAEKECARRFAVLRYFCFEADGQQGAIDRIVRSTCRRNEVAHFILYAHGVRGETGGFGVSGFSGSPAESQAVERKKPFAAFDIGYDRFSARKIATEAGPRKGEGFRRDVDSGKKKEKKQNGESHFILPFTELPSRKRRGIRILWERSSL